MSRGARLAIGLSGAGALLLVSLVSVIVGAVLAGGGAFGSSGGIFDEGYAEEFMTARADAEVLDVDEEFGWTWVDVRFEAQGEVVVTGFDWAGDLPPDVGDVVEVAYDPADPEYSLLPVADLGPSATGGDDPESAAPLVDDGAATPRSAVLAFWVAGVSGALALVAAVLTVIWSVRAEEPGTSPGLRPPPGYWSPPPASTPPPWPAAQPPPPPPLFQATAPPSPAPTGWGPPSG